MELVPLQEEKKEEEETAEFSFSPPGEDTVRRQPPISQKEGLHWKPAMLAP
jgi:hypothetical protein